MFKTLISLMLFVSFTCPVKAIVNNDISVCNEAVNMIKEMENKELTVLSYEVLLDVEMVPNYLLIHLDKAYAIISREQGIVSEYSLNNSVKPYFDCKRNDILVYGGPGNYYSFTPTNEKSFLNKNIFKVSSQLLEQNRIFLSIEKQDSITSSNRSVNYQGISSGIMSKFSDGKWINSKSNYPVSQGYSQNGICGTIVAAVLLAYNDDYYHDNTVPSNHRTRFSTSPGILIERLFSLIDKKYPAGTLANNVSVGIDDYLELYSSSVASKYDSKYSLATTFSKAKQVINAGHPIAIGLSALLNSSYGNHWVVAYQYYDDPNGSSNDMYRCVDNHGDYYASVNVSWSSGYVYLDY